MEYYIFNGNVDACAGISNEGVLVRFEDLIRSYDGDEHLNTIEANITGITLAEFIFNGK